MSVVKCLEHTSRNLPESFGTCPLKMKSSHRLLSFSRDGIACSPLSRFLQPTTAQRLTPLDILARAGKNTDVTGGDLAFRAFERLGNGRGPTSHPPDRWRVAHRGGAPLFWLQRNSNLYQLRCSPIFRDLGMEEKREGCVFWHTGDTYSCIKDVQKCILHDRSP